MYKRPYSSPWGKIQHIKKKTAGVYEVSTEGHGGIMVCTEAASQILSPTAIEHGVLRNGFYCFEEDCDASIVIRELLDKNLWKTPKHYIGREVEYSEIINASLFRWNLNYLVALGEEINIKHKGLKIERVAKAPNLRIEEGKDPAVILLNFYRDLGWNPDTHSIEPKKVRTTTTVFNSIYDAIVEIGLDSGSVGMLMLNKGPSGGHDDTKDGMIVLLEGWLIPEGEETT